MEELVKNHTFATHAVTAAASVALASSLTQPLDSLKSLLQVAAGSPHRWSLGQVSERVRSVSGFSGFYNGLGWTALGRISGLGLRYGTFELLSAFFRDGTDYIQLDVYEALLAGIAAGSAEAFVSTPFELFKLRSQLSSASYTRTNLPEAISDRSPYYSKLLRGYSPDIKSLRDIVAALSVLPTKTTDLFSALKEYPWMLTGSAKPPLGSEIKSPLHIISLEGWSALWRGLRAGLVRDCIFGGVFFSTWQFLHIELLNRKAANMNPPPRSAADVGSPSPLGISLSAGLSGSVAAAASHSFDTAKTREQSIVLPKYMTMERKFLKWKPQGPWLLRMTGISDNRSVLYHGFWLRTARSGAASFVIVGSYLWAVDHLF